MARSLEPRLLLGYVHLQEGKDLAAADQALREVLALDPHHAEARYNLTLVARQRGQAAAS